MSTTREELGQLIRTCLDTFIAQRITMISGDVIGVTNTLVDAIEHRFEINPMRNEDIVDTAGRVRAPAVPLSPPALPPAPIVPECCEASQFCETLLDDIELLLGEITVATGLSFLESVRSGVQRTLDEIQRNNDVSDRNHSNMEGWRRGVDGWMKNRR